MTLESMGLAEAQEACEELRTALAEYSGCYYRGTTRADGKRNAQVVTWLAEQEPRADGMGGRRDLRTMSDNAAAELGQQFTQEMLKAMTSMYKKKGGLKKAYAAKPDYARAKIQAARAWRVVGKNYLGKMWQRLQSQLSADDEGKETSAPAVELGYAVNRQKKYGVGIDRVYMATGDLFEDLSPEDGRIALVKGGAAIGRAEFAAEVASAGRAIAGAFGIHGPLKGRG